MLPKRGVLGIYAQESDCAEMMIDAIAKQQHRGTKFWGLAVSGEEGITCVTDEGFVSHSNSRLMDEMQGNIGIAHVSSEDPQPIVRYSMHGQFAVCFDGFNPDIESQRVGLMAKSGPFVTMEDVEVLSGFINHGLDVIDGIIDAVRLVVGPCSMLVLTRDAIFASRDPHGWRPLVVGKDEKDTWIVASESCAFGSRFKLVRDVHPGEIVRINQKGIQTIYQFSNKRLYCIQGWLHSARVDSLIDKIDVAEVRHHLGQRLARKYDQLDIDMISPVPFAAFTYAEGVQKILGVPLVQAFHRPHYDSTYSVIPRNVRGKKILLVDDLLRTGNTLKRLISDLREADASKVYVGIATPPSREDCRYWPQGTQTFLASMCNMDEICQAIGADGFQCLDVKSLPSAFGEHRRHICMKCFEH